MGHVTLTTPTWGQLVMKRLILHVANSCTKFEVSVAVAETFAETNTSRSQLVYEI